MKHVMSADIGFPKRPPIPCVAAYIKNSQKWPAPLTEPFSPTGGCPLTRAFGPPDRKGREEGAFERPTSTGSGHS